MFDTDDLPACQIQPAPPPRFGGRYPEPDRNLIPLNPPLVPRHLDVRDLGRCVVERVSLDALADGSWEQERGVRFLETRFFGRLGNIAVYVPRSWPRAGEAPPQEADDD